MTTFFFQKRSRQCRTDINEHNHAYYTGTVERVSRPGNCKTNVCCIRPEKPCLILNPHSKTPRSATETSPRGNCRIAISASKNRCTFVCVCVCTCQPCMMRCVSRGSQSCDHCVGHYLVITYSYSTLSFLPQKKKAVSRIQSLCTTN